MKMESTSLPRMLCAVTHVVWFPGVELRWLKGGQSAGLSVKSREVYCAQLTDTSLKKSRTGEMGILFTPETLSSVSVRLSLGSDQSVYCVNVYYVLYTYNLLPKAREEKK